jgi:HK97 family phage major capsid protein
MRLTDALKKWAVENKEVADDADDSTFSKAVAEALVDGSLSDDQFIAMNKDPDAEKASALATKLATLEESNKQTQEALQKLIELSTAKAAVVQEPKPEIKKVESGVTADILGDGEKTDDDVTVKHITADKRYDGTKAAKYVPMQDSKGRRTAKGGMRLAEGSRTIDEQSELERAVCGAWAKHSIFGPLVAQGQVPASVITDHDKELIQYAANNMEWVGEKKAFGEEGGTLVRSRKLEPNEVKQVIDVAGNAMGGDELVPVVWDNAIITTPLLHGEFFPRVNIVNVPQGRIMQSATIGNPVVTWNATEATAVALTSTADFVAEFDTNIFTASAAITVGLDTLSDTPVNFGDVVTANAGQAFLNSFDDAIVSGDGTSAPTGIHDQGAAGAVGFGSEWTIGDMVTLMNTVAKEYKAGYDANRIAWGAHPSTYGDVRALATGVTGDTRVIFGQNIDSYMVLDHPFLINDTYGVQEMNFVNLARYRMYRRLGITSRMETAGRTLALANQALLVFRARLGGQLETTAACAYTDDGAA